MISLFGRMILYLMIVCEYSIFCINDDLSIGYAHTESDGKGASADPEVDSIQAAYTMGGASIRLAETDVTNNAYQSAAVSAGAPNDRSGTTISVSLAF